ncbi:MAG: hypothetical protein IH840_08625 [Candidatus Heimdallarchaeota archaeon]|nr:hypothetical protein [Candidatus Heimdallarchaeota archaeon]
MADRSDVVRKKALIMTLGNTKDLQGLLNLLSAEENDEIKCDIITCIAALGQIESGQILSSMLQIEVSDSVRGRLRYAIDVLEQFTRY